MKLDAVQVLVLLFGGGGIVSAIALLRKLPSDLTTASWGQAQSAMAIMETSNKTLERDNARLRDELSAATLRCEQMRTERDDARRERDLARRERGRTEGDQSRREKR